MLKKEKRRIEKKGEPRNQEILVQHLPLKSCVICDKSLNFSGPQCLILQDQQGGMLKVMHGADIVNYLQIKGGSDSQLYTL